MSLEVPYYYKDQSCLLTSEYFFMPSHLGYVEIMIDRYTYIPLDPCATYL